MSRVEGQPLPLPAKVLATVTLLGGAAGLVACGGSGETPKVAGGDGTPQPTADRMDLTATPIGTFLVPVEDTPEPTATVEPQVKTPQELIEIARAIEAKYPGNSDANLARLALEDGDNYVGQMELDPNRVTVSAPLNSFGQARLFTGKLACSNPDDPTLIAQYDNVSAYMQRFALDHIGPQLPADRAKAILDYPQFSAPCDLK